MRESKGMWKRVCGFLIGLLMALMGCGGTITDKVCEEELFVDTIEAQSVLAYDSWTDFKDEWGLPYADEEKFGVLKEAYANVDFFGEFKEGNESVCEEYKIKFRKCFNNEVPFLDKRTGEKICIKDYGRFENGYDVNEFTYYFFDVDEAENKELVTEKMKTQGVYERSCGRWYFRVTEEQYKELMEEYWQAYELAEEKIEGVTYTYEELFGENDSKDIIVGCEAE